ncbi:unnamed protein product [Caenorhabditis auriculariae]|uniref:Uncharacterized protein n=1 Tax=Caenorhabditis auriculariae TaxID=2777116 RepID=A0A8S1HQL0_9PELO|nr:unnamed protein product [Caenorhabditis auriculariae]
MAQGAAREKSYCRDAPRRISSAGNPCAFEEELSGASFQRLRAVMAFKMEVSQLKIAEKLVILNDRAAGMLTRLYNIKKACGEPKSKPSFLSDKQMEGAIKHVVRKFPVVDTRSNSSTFNYVSTLKEDITKMLSSYYYTFADLLELRDNILQLLSSMDACQCRLDITINYELTTGYLNLVVNLITMMILLSRIDDRKAVLGLFNAAYDLQHGQSESTFPRLGQMILDYEHPLKKLHEDLLPLNRLIMSGLKSLETVFTRRNITGEVWRTSQILSLTANSPQIVYSAQTDTNACEFLSLDVMDRWMILCGTVCYSKLLNDPTISRMWQLSLQMGICLRIFRDEVFSTHQEIQHFLESIKGNSKRIQEVKDCYSVALQQGISIHAERRRFLRSALRELVLIFKDRPGILGPKALFVWMALCYSRDEVLWLLRHMTEWPSKKGSKQTDELMDKLLPELLHYTTPPTTTPWFLGEMLANLDGLQEDEMILLSDFVASVKAMNAETDFRGLRLDWFRFQAWTSVAQSSFSLHSHKQLAIMMNTTVFHLKMVDLQDELLRETSDLSIFCFYQALQQRQWLACLQLPSQCRFTLSFARLAAHFPSSLHLMCPEEKSRIIEKALNQCKVVLEEVCRMTCDVVAQLCEYELRLSEQMSPSTVAIRFVAQYLQDKGPVNKAATAAINAAREYVVAGEESYRVERNALTWPEKLQTTLLELCAGIGMHRQIWVADHAFAPREFLTQRLELKLVDMLHAMIWEGQPHQSNPRRPSDMLLALQAYMTVLQDLDTAVHIDIITLIKSVLLQQTQGADGRSKETITAIYTKWYLEVLLRRASHGDMVWSDHLKSMLVWNHDQLPFVPEQYTDPSELRALVQIIGSYGVKYMSERLIWHVASQINEIYKIVVSHKEALQVARSNFDNAEKMKEVLAVLSTEPKDKKNNPGAKCPADAILSRTTIIGQICSFRDALHTALRQVLDKRMTFLSTTFDILYESVDDMGKVALGELSSAMGISGPIDSSLVSSIRAHNPNINPDDHYTISCLALVAIAICIPRIGASDMSTFKPTIQGSFNNSHCIPLAVNTMASALFHLHGRGDIQLRMKEFLALASSGILRTAQEGEKDENSRSQTTLYIILEQLVRKNRWLTMDVLEACFPYNLVRTAYQQSAGQRDGRRM